MVIIFQPNVPIMRQGAQLASDRNIYVPKSTTVPVPLCEYQSSFKYMYLL